MQEFTVFVYKTIDFTQTHTDIMLEGLYDHIPMEYSFADLDSMISLLYDAMWCYLSAAKWNSFTAIYSRNRKYNGARGSVVC
jgi:hypothetical protein